MAFLLSFTLMVLTSTFLTVSSLSSIPALLWSPERSMSQLPEVMGLDPIKSDDFLNGYLTPLMDNPLESAVIFIQDKLSTDDFTRYADVYTPNSKGGSFENIKECMENHFSMELPQVSNPCDAVEKLKASFSGDVHTVTSVDQVESLNLDKDKKVLIIVHLNPVTGQKDQENVIQQNDATVGAISQHLKKRSIKYSALFTGRAASDDHVESVESHSSRRLMADSSSSSANYNGTFMNVSNGDIYVFLKEAFVVMKYEGKTYSINLTVDADTANNSTQDNKTAVIQLDFKDAKFNDTSYNIKIRTEAVNLKDRWVMSRVSLDIVGGVVPTSNFSLENATLSSGDMDFTIPILYSWHCTDMKLNLETVYNKDNAQFKGSYIQLTGYQVQAFNIQKNRFFDAQDCVGYFTTAIWMFLFSSIFLVSILIFGVLMVLSLSTMDKYDDPKGKTITVAQGTD
uniref:V-type proton ATPase subunit S1/VOA1 transmembrane domain-containing protein n=1 Tax=Arion vulgaris TaxID=1028688 RepID=A0A0B7ANW2_9EUPU